MAKSQPKPLKGVLFFHSETGTEGGYWALQDECHISYVPARYVWGSQNVWDQVRSERKGRTQEGAEVLHDGEWLPLPDPMQEDPDYFVSSLFCGEKRGNREADQRLMEKYGFIIKYAADQMNERFGEGNWRLEGEGIAVTTDGTRWAYGLGVPQTDPWRPYGVAPGELTRVTVEWEDGVVEERLSDSLLVRQWSYEGLHYLGNGDHLTIYEKDGSGQIRWEGKIRLRQHPLFTETVFGMWIHADMKGWGREEWARLFFEEYPAELVPA